MSQFWGSLHRKALSVATRSTTPLSCPLFVPLLSFGLYFHRGKSSLSKRHDIFTQTLQRWALLACVPAISKKPLDIREVLVYISDVTYSTGSLHLVPQPFPLH